MIPSDSVGWLFKDIIPDASSCYLVAEFYKNDTTNVWKFKSTATPFKVVKSAVSLGSATGMAISITVPIADIISSGSLGTGSCSFYVCVGFNKYSGTTAQGSSAFVAPWQVGAHKCATLVTVTVASPYVVSFTKYCFDPSSTFVDFPTAVLNVTGNQTSMKFQATVQNHASTALKIYSAKNMQTSGLIFRARAVGSYGAYHNDNTGYTTDDSTGINRIMYVGTGAGVNVTNSSDSITVNANSSSTLYFFAENLLPYGDTIGIIIEVSNDGGSTWATTGMKNCQFRRTP